MPRSVLKALVVGGAALYVWYVAVTHVGEVKERKALRRAGAG